METRDWIEFFGWAVVGAVVGKFVRLGVVVGAVVDARLKWIEKRR